jgi:2-hydroxycyclohexanecarboxyl-CoA dehydrogenase
MTPVAVRGALALVTGAGSGIGRATALALAARGARVLSVDIDEVAAKETAEACGRRGTPGAAFAADVADRTAVLELAASVTAEMGVLDILVNNAGVGLSGPFLDTTLDDWDWILGVNLLGVVHCCAAFGRPMVQRGGGHVVNVSSGLAYTHRATEGPYGATKAAVLALSRSLRADWRAAGVGVSAICPGVINTPIVAHTRMRGVAADPSATARAQRLFSRGHPPERVADAILSAIARNRAVVPVGFEAWLGWVGSRLLPPDAMDRIVGTSQRLTAPD